MLYLNKQDIIRSITPQEIMEAIEKAYGLFTAGNYFMPDRPTVEYQNKTIVYMPCFADGAMGQKILTVFPENTQRGLPAIDGLMLLCDYDTGIPQVMMDGKALTALRTGGVGGVAVRHLSPADAHTLAVIGAGVQGANQAAFASTFMYTMPMPRTRRHLSTGWRKFWGKLILPSLSVPPPKKPPGKARSSSRPPHPMSRFFLMTVPFLPKNAALA